MEGVVSSPRFMPSVKVPMPGQSSLDGMNSSGKSDSTRKNVDPPTNSDRKICFLPFSPIGSHQPIQLDNGQWEFGIDVQGQMVKSAGPMMNKLGKGVDYPKFKRWASTFYDWITSHTHLSPEQLGPYSLWVVLRLSISE